MSNLFAQIDDTLKHIPHGWCTPEKACAMASAILTMRPEVVLEIGIWAGRSLIPMAMAVHHVKQGKVIGIDPWSAEAATVGQEGANFQWWRDVPYEMIYNQFLKDVQRFGVSQVIEIHRKKSDDVDPPKNIGLLHVDGNHGPQAVRDVDRFAPNVRVGGLVFCDDIGWAGGGVSQSVEHLKHLGFEQLYTLDTGALFQRVK